MGRKTRAAKVKVLERELATWEQHRNELLRTAPDRWVLIRQDRVAGTFASEQEAFDHAYRVYGLVPFLVRKIAERDEPVEILGLGILR